MEKPLVSVIMGIYNTAESLPQSIQSILDQTYTNWELIMCDDCSTDNTYEVAVAYAEKYSNIKVVRNEQNMRLAYSLNHCLKYAQGQYVARMDADDICFPERFEKQVEFLNTHKEYMVVGSALIPYDESGERAPRMIKEYPVARDMKRGVTFFHPTVMMRKEAYDALDGYYVSKRTRKGQDLDLWFRFYAKGFKGHNIQEPLLKYHESLEDYKKKRNISYSWDMCKTALHGFKINRFPIYLYPWIFKDLVSALVPRWMRFMRHKKATKGEKK